MSSAEFKTKNGTMLPIRNLRGSKYLDVQWRIVWFREDHPNSTIDVKIIEHDSDHSVVRADVYMPDGKLWSSAYKREDKVHFLDHLEKASTSAIGRALALCGYGTQFTVDFNEEERLADAPVEPSKKDLSHSQRIDLIRKLQSLSNAKSIKPVEMSEIIKTKYQVDSTAHMTEPQLKELVSYLSTNA